MIWPLDHLIEAWTFSRTKFPPAGILPDDRSSAPTADDLARKALEIAISELKRGAGEAGGNNMGPDVERYISPATAPQNWCAGFAGWCYQEAARQLAWPLPFRRSLGAKALGKAVATAGRSFTDPHEAQPGDLIIFDRGVAGSWQGHVGLVERIGTADSDRGAVYTVEGNSAPVVRRRTHRVDVASERFAFFASIRKPAA